MSTKNKSLASSNGLTDQIIFDRLSKVMDPELNIDIVSLGLIYGVDVKKLTQSPTKYQVLITMTLTTPGCPLAGMFDGMLRSALMNLPDLNPATDVEIELTFDPPWVPDMMSEEARAELGFE
jgi:metal-sulfur cluster biosynthetic enzyme